jgi:hypothetical protein
MHAKIYRNKDVGVYAEADTIYGFSRKILLPFIEKDYCARHATDRNDDFRMACLDYIALVHFKPPANASNIILFGDEEREHVKTNRHRVLTSERREVIRYIIREVSKNGLPPSRRDMEDHLCFIMIECASKPIRDFWDKANDLAATLGAQYGYGTREWIDAMYNATYHL